jgi:myosin heavy subunit
MTDEPEFQDDDAAAYERTYVWISSDGDQPFIKVEFVAEEGNMLRVRMGEEIGSEERLVPADQCQSAANEQNDDLVQMDAVNEATVLDTCHQRFDNQNIYTNLSDILVALNPYQYLDHLYNPEVMEKYCRISRQGITMPPHVFAIADTCYRGVTEEQRCQAIVISGESGAGKTETTKKCLQYITYVALQFSKKADVSAPAGRERSATQVAREGIEDKILSASPILESFGNSKTLRNNNSSRFGKWMELMFTPLGVICGCTNTNYLLEKSRVVMQAQGERNFHIFYAITEGALESQKQQCDIGGARQYRYTNGSNCFEVEGIDDSEWMQEVLEAFCTLGFTETQQEHVMQLLAGILQLGMLQFEHESDTHGSQVVKNADQTKVLGQAARSCGVSAAALEKAITQDTLVVRGESMEVHLEPVNAQSACDTLAKAIYGRMFDWLVQTINVQMLADSKDGAGRTGKKKLFIGILDIFGFEVFQENSFEQLCINYCNEKLQQHFIHFVFKMETEVYNQEGINFNTVTFVDNQDMLDLIEQKPYGLFRVLEEEIITPKGNDEGFYRKFIKLNDTKLRLKASKGVYRENVTKFTLRHYAGEVAYTPTGFMKKNRDVLHHDLHSAMLQSATSLAGELFKRTPDEQQEEDERQGGSSHKRAPSTAKGKSSKARQTLSYSFGQSLDSLMTQLHLAAPNFIRCIKPNTTKSCTAWDHRLVLQQLHYSGVIDAVEVRKSGYPFRRTHAAFCRRYILLLPKQDRAPFHAKQAKSTERERAAALLECLQASTETEVAVASGEGPPSALSAIQLGKTQLFYRTEEHQVLEHWRGMMVAQAGTHIQRAYRGMLGRRRWNKLQEQRLQLRAALRVQACYRKILAIHRKIVLRVARQRLRDAMAGRDRPDVEAAVKEAAQKGVELPEVGQGQALLAVLLEEEKVAATLQELAEASFTDLAVYEKMAATLESADKLGMGKHKDGAVAVLVAKSTAAREGVRERMECKQALIAGTSSSLKGKLEAALKLAQEKSAEWGDDLVAAEMSAAQVTIDRIKQEEAGPLERLRIALSGGMASGDTGAMDASGISTGDLDEAVAGAGTFEVRTPDGRMLLQTAKLVTQMRKALAEQNWGAVEAVLEQCSEDDDSGGTARRESQIVLVNAGDGKQKVHPCARAEVAAARSEWANRLVVTEMKAALSSGGVTGTVGALDTTCVVLSEIDGALLRAKELTSGKNATEQARQLVEAVNGVRDLRQAMVTAAEAVDGGRWVYGSAGRHRRASVFDEASALLAAAEGEAAALKAVAEQCAGVDAALQRIDQDRLKRLGSEYALAETALGGALIKHVSAVSALHTALGCGGAEAAAGEDDNINCAPVRTEQLAAALKAAAAACEDPTTITSQLQALMHAGGGVLEVRQAQEERVGGVGAAEAGPDWDSMERAVTRIIQEPAPPAEGASDTAGGGGGGGGGGGDSGWLPARAAAEVRLANRACEDRRMVRRLTEALGRGSPQGKVGSLDLSAVVVDELASVIVSCGGDTFEELAAEEGEPAAANTLAALAPAKAKAASDQARQLLRTAELVLQLRRALVAQAYETIEGLIDLGSLRQAVSGGTAYSSVSHAARLGASPLAEAELSLSIIEVLDRVCAKELADVMQPEMAEHAAALAACVARAEVLPGPANMSARTAGLLNVGRQLLGMRQALVSKDWDGLRKCLEGISEDEQYATQVAEEVEMARGALEDHEIISRLSQALQGGGAGGMVGAVKTADVKTAPLEAAVAYAKQKVCKSAEAVQQLKVSQLVLRLRLNLLQAGAGAVVTSGADAGTDPWQESSLAVVLEEPLARQLMGEKVEGEAEALLGEWIEGLDPLSGRQYFYNTQTRRSSWMQPSAIGAGADGKRRQRRSSMAAAVKPGLPPGGQELTLARQELADRKLCSAMAVALGKGGATGEAGRISLRAVQVELLEGAVAEANQQGCACQRSAQLLGACVLVLDLRRAQLAGDWESEGLGGTGIGAEGAGSAAGRRESAAGALGAMDDFPDNVSVSSSIISTLATVGGGRAGDGGSRCVKGVLAREQRMSEADAAHVRSPAARAMRSELRLAREELAVRAVWAALTAALANGAAFGSVGSMDLSTVETGSLAAAVAEAEALRKTISHADPEADLLIKSCKLVLQVREALISRNWDRAATIIRAQDLAKASAQARVELTMVRDEVDNAEVLRVLGGALAGGGARGTVTSLDTSTVRTRELEAALEASKGFGVHTARAAALRHSARIMLRLRKALLLQDWDALASCVREAKGEADGRDRFADSDSEEEGGGSKLLPNAEEAAEAEAEEALVAELVARGEGPPRGGWELSELVADEMQLAQECSDDHRVRGALAAALQTGRVRGRVGLVELEDVSTDAIADAMELAESLGAVTPEATALLVTAQHIERLRSSMLNGNWDAVEEGLAELEGDEDAGGILLAEIALAEIELVRTEVHDRKILAALTKSLQQGMATGEIGAADSAAHVSTSEMEEAITRARKFSDNRRSSNVRRILSTSERVLTLRQAERADNWAEVGQLADALREGDGAGIPEATRGEVERARIESNDKLLQKTLADAMSSGRVCDALLESSVDEVDPQLVETEALAEAVKQAAARAFGTGGGGDAGGGGGGGGSLDSIGEEGAGALAPRAGSDGMLISSRTLMHLRSAQLLLAMRQAVRRAQWERVHTLLRHVAVGGVAAACAEEVEAVRAIADANQQHRILTDALAAGMANAWASTAKGSGARWGGSLLDIGTIVTTHLDAAIGDAERLTARLVRPGVEATRLLRSAKLVRRVRAAQRSGEWEALRGCVREADAEPVHRAAQAEVASAALELRSRQLTERVRRALLLGRPHGHTGSFNLDDMHMEALQKVVADEDAAAAAREAAHAAHEERQAALQAEIKARAADPDAAGQELTRQRGNSSAEPFVARLAAEPAAVGGGEGGLGAAYSARFEPGASQGGGGGGGEQASEAFGFTLRGPQVYAVEPQGEAERLGVTAGSFVLSVNGATPHAADEIQQLVAEAQAAGGGAQAVHIQFRRVEQGEADSSRFAYEFASRAVEESASLSSQNLLEVARLIAQLRASWKVEDWDGMQGQLHALRKQQGGAETVEKQAAAAATANQGRARGESTARRFSMAVLAAHTETEAAGGGGGLSVQAVPLLQAVTDEIAMAEHELRDQSTARALRSALAEGAPGGTPGAVRYSDIMVAGLNGAIAMAMDAEPVEPQRRRAQTRLEGRHRASTTQVASQMRSRAMSSISSLGDGGDGGGAFGGNGALHSAMHDAAAAAAAEGAAAGAGAGGGADEEGEDGMWGSDEEGGGIGELDLTGLEKLRGASDDEDEEAGIDEEQKKDFGELTEDGDVARHRSPCTETLLFTAKLVRQMRADLEAERWEEAHKSLVALQRSRVERGLEACTKREVALVQTELSDRVVRVRLEQALSVGNARWAAGNRLQATHIDTGALDNALMFASEEQLKADTQLRLADQEAELMAIHELSDSDGDGDGDGEDEDEGEGGEGGEGGRPKKSADKPHVGGARRHAEAKESRERYVEMHNTARQSAKGRVLTFVARCMRAMRAGVMAGEWRGVRAALEQLQPSPDGTPAPARILAAMRGGEPRSQPDDDADAQGAAAVGGVGDLAYLYDALSHVLDVDEELEVANMAAERAAKAARARAKSKRMSVQRRRGEKQLVALAGAAAATGGGDSDDELGEANGGFGLTEEEHFPFQEEGRALSEHGGDSDGEEGPPADGDMPQQSLNEHGWVDEETVEVKWAAAQAVLESDSGPLSTVREELLVVSAAAHAAAVQEALEGSLEHGAIVWLQTEGALQGTGEAWVDPNAIDMSRLDVAIELAHREEFRSARVAQLLHAAQMLRTARAAVKSQQWEQAELAITALDALDEQLAENGGGGLAALSPAAAQELLAAKSAVFTRIVVSQLKLALRTGAAAGETGARQTACIQTEGLRGALELADRYPQGVGSSEAVQLLGSAKIVLRLREALKQTPTDWEAVHAALEAATAPVLGHTGPDGPGGEGTGQRHRLHVCCRAEVAAAEDEFTDRFVCSELISALQAGGASGSLERGIDVTSISVDGLDAALETAEKLNCATPTGVQLMRSCRVIRQLRLALLATDTVSHAAPQQAAAAAAAAAGGGGADGEGDKGDERGETDYQPPVTSSSAWERVKELVMRQELALEGIAPMHRAAMDELTRARDEVHTAMVMKVLLQQLESADAWTPTQPKTFIHRHAADQAAEKARRAVAEQMGADSLRLDGSEEVEASALQRAQAAAQEEAEQQSRAQEHDRSAHARRRCDNLAVAIARAEELGCKTGAARRLLRSTKHVLEVRRALVAGQWDRAVRALEETDFEAVAEQAVGELERISNELDNALITDKLERALLQGAAAGEVGVLDTSTVDTLELRRAIGFTVRKGCKTAETAGLLHTAEIVCALREALQEQDWGRVADCLHARKDSAVAEELTGGAAAAAGVAAAVGAGAAGAGAGAGAGETSEAGEDGELELPVVFAEGVSGAEMDAASAHWADHTLRARLSSALRNGRIGGNVGGLDLTGLDLRELDSVLRAARHELRLGTQTHAAQVLLRTAELTRKLRSAVRDGRWEAAVGALASGEGEEMASIVQEEWMLARAESADRRVVGQLTRALSRGMASGSAGEMDSSTVDTELLQIAINTALKLNPAVQEQEEMLLRREQERLSMGDDQDAGSTAAAAPSEQTSGASEQALVLLRTARIVLPLRQALVAGQWDKISALVKGVDTRKLSEVARSEVMAAQDECDNRVIVMEITAALSKGIEMTRGSAEAGGSLDPLAESQQQIHAEVGAVHAEALSTALENARKLRCKSEGAQALLEMSDVLRKVRSALQDTYQDHEDGGMGGGGGERDGYGRTPQRKPTDSPMSKDHVQDWQKVAEAVAHARAREAELSLVLVQRFPETRAGFLAYWKQSVDDADAQLQDVSATRIQASYRGNKLRNAKAAQTLQRAWNWHQGQRDLAGMLATFRTAKRAAVGMQALTRMRPINRKYEEERGASKMLQAQVRGRINRVQYKQGNAARVMQSQWRGTTQKANLRASLFAAVRLQSRWRAARNAKAFATAQSAARKLQAGIRGRGGRLMFLHAVVLAALKAGAEADPDAGGESGGAAANAARAARGLEWGERAAARIGPQDPELQRLVATGSVVKGMRGAAAEGDMTAMAGLLESVSGADGLTVHRAAAKEMIRTLDRVEYELAPKKLHELMCRGRVRGTDVGTLELATTQRELPELEAMLAAVQRLQPQDARLQRQVRGGLVLCRLRTQLLRGRIDAVAADLAPLIDLGDRGANYDATHSDYALMSTEDEAFVREEMATDGSRPRGMSGGAALSADDGFVYTMGDELKCIRALVMHGQLRGALERGLTEGRVTEKGPFPDCNHVRLVNLQAAISAFDAAAREAVLELPTLGFSSEAAPHDLADLVAPLRESAEVVLSLRAGLTSAGVVGPGQNGESKMFVSNEDLAGCAQALSEIRWGDVVEAASAELDAVRATLPNEVRCRELLRRARTAGLEGDLAAVMAAVAEAGDGHEGRPGMKLREHPSDRIQQEFRDERQRMYDMKQVRADLRSGVAHSDAVVLEIALQRGAGFGWGKDTAAKDGDTAAVDADAHMRLMRQLQSRADAAYKRLDVGELKAVLAAAAALQMEVPKERELRGVTLMPEENICLLKIERYNDAQAAAAGRVGVPAVLQLSDVAEASMRLMQLRLAAEKVKSDLQLFSGTACRNCPVMSGRARQAAAQGSLGCLSTGGQAGSAGVNAQVASFEKVLNFEAGLTNGVRAQTARDLFEFICTYVGGLTESTNAASELVRYGLAHEEARDEIFCQLMLQLADGPGGEAAPAGRGVDEMHRTWQLLQLSLESFPPSHGLVRSAHTCLPAFLPARRTNPHSARIAARCSNLRLPFARLCSCVTWTPSCAWRGRRPACCGCTSRSTHRKRSARC